MTTIADSQALLLQLLDQSNRADPYPAYDRIREHGPLQLPDMTLNVFSSYQDCDDVLRSVRSPTAPRLARSARPDSCSSTRPTTRGCASW